MAEMRASPQLPLANLALIPSRVWVESGQINQANNRFNSGVTYDDAGNVTVDSKFRNLQFQYDANNRQKQSASLDGAAWRLVKSWI